MPRIELSTRFNAPIEIVFDLARNIDAHTASAAWTRERAIAGRTSGIIEPGETVTWQARHFGIRWSMTVQITSFNAPLDFTDEMVTGPFRSMRHVHHFETIDDATIMRDVFEFQAPFGPLGTLAEQCFLTAYMTRFIKRRNEHLQEILKSV